MVDADLAAIVVELCATKTLTVEHHMGRAAQQVALDIVRRQSESLSEKLHEDRDVKAYTVSGLLYADAVAVIGKVKTGDTAWIRIGGLHGDVVEALHNFAAHPPPESDFNRERCGVKTV